jgi:predicted P-loop ATPase
MEQSHFRITDFVSFNKGRAICPACQRQKGEGYRKLNLVLLESGAYHCHRGCTPEEIREALGKPKETIAIGTISTTNQPRSKITLTPQKVKEANDALMKSDGAAKQWLHDRGITDAMIQHYQLGVARSKVGKKHLWSIGIPIPVNSDRTSYYQKKRVAPWDPEAKQLADYKPWSQYGIPATIFFTHHPPAAKSTWLCEGEWDAMMLGYLAMTNLKGVAIATFTCGANTVPSKEELQQLPGEVIIFYDRNDEPLPNGVRPGEAGAQKVADALRGRGRIALVPMPDGCTQAGWDVSNAIQTGFTFTDFERAASTARFTQERDKSTLDIATIAKTRKGRILEALGKTYGDRLQYNTLAKQVELDGSPIDPDFVYLSLLEEGLDVGSKEFAIDAFLYLAKRNAYNSVQQYLERVESQHPANLELLHTAARRYLGNPHPLHNIFLKKTLIAAVARALQPGCKVDTALIFVGRQGVGKSTFWATLAGEWFCDSLSGQTSDTDEKIKLYSAWIHEWAELEQVFKRKETSQVKAFLSATTDTFRQPWGRSAEKHKRHSIIVGTTNEDDFLADATGSRRYWVLPIHSQVCLELLERERDQLWATAVHAYREGASWILTTAEAQESESQNQAYRREDPWFPAIEQWLGFQSEIRVCDLLSQAVGLELSRQDRAAQMRAADCLKSLGWQKRHTKAGKIWVKGSHVVTDLPKSNLGSSFNDDYLSPKGSHQVVTGSHLTENDSTDHFLEGDHLSGDSGHPGWSPPETPDGIDSQASGDYVTTKNALNLSSFLPLPPESDQRGGETPTEKGSLISPSGDLTAKSDQQEGKSDQQEGKSDQQEGKSDQQEGKSDQRRAKVISDSLEVGDKVEILSGQLGGQHVFVEGIEGDTAIVKGARWLLTRSYNLQELRLVKKGGTAL